LKKNLLILVYAIVLILLVTYTTLPDELRAVEKNYHFEKIVNLDKKNLFNVMSQIEDYSTIFPDNYLSVSVINKTNSIVYTQETIREAGITTTLDVKHIIIPYDSHQIEILSGDAKNTKIIISFEERGLATKIDVDAQLHFKGILSPFGYIPQNNMDHATNTVIKIFLDYTKSNP
jgi:ribosome-associated toxin RatA of RatAB toxin-antitoxin module